MTKKIFSIFLIVSSSFILASEYSFDFKIDKKFEFPDSQARADVAQSIYNRKASGAYGSGSIRDLILQKTQYEPVWTYPNGQKNGYGNPNDEWYNIVDAQTAAAATGESVAFINQAAADIKNTTNQRKAKEFVGGRTDFTNYSKSNRKGQIVRDSSKPNNYFGWDWNYTGSKMGSLSFLYDDTENPEPVVLFDFTSYCITSKVKCSTIIILHCKINGEIRTLVNQ